MESERKKYRARVDATTAVLEWLDAPTLETLETALLHLAQLIAGPPLPLLVIDHTTDFKPRTSDLQESVFLAGQYRHCIGPRIALVVKNELHYGLGRMMETFCQDIEILFKPFRSIEEARQWLLGPAA